MISCKINNYCVLGPRREIDRIFGFMRGIPSLTKQEYSGDQEIRRSGDIPVRSQEEAKEADWAKFSKLFFIMFSFIYILLLCHVIIVTEYLTEIHMQKVNQCHVDQCH